MLSWVRARQNAQTPVNKSNTAYNAIGEWVVSDLIGPIQVESVRGAHYYVLFKNVYSKYKTVYFLKHKSEAGDRFLDYTLKILTETGKRTLILRVDGGGEYISNAHCERYTELKIKFQTCAAYTPEQNGIAERNHRTTVESAKAQLHAK